MPKTIYISELRRSMTFKGSGWSMAPCPQSTLPSFVMPMPIVHLVRLFFQLILSQPWANKTLYKILPTKCSGKVSCSTNQTLAAQVVSNVKTHTHLQWTKNKAEHMQVKGGTSNSLVVIRIHKKQGSVYALRFIKAAKFEQDGCHLFFE